MRLSRSSRLLKLVLDVVGASLALILLLPAFVVIGILIKLDSPGPVFFRQVRMGAWDQPFRIFKFRTMFVDAERRKDELYHLNQHLLAGEDARMFKVANDPRITRLGPVLRRYSLDELPQLINVLAARCHWSGPRPCIPYEVEKL